MVRLVSRMVGALLLCALSPALRAAAPLPLIQLAADNWPPFVTPALPGNGLSGALVESVYQRLGYDLRIDYFPWKRAMEFGLHHPDYAGLLPVWRTPEREKLCYFSSSIGSTQTVLAYLKDGGVHPDSLAALRGQHVGIVAGYAYGEQFDAARERGELTVETGVNDETNVHKLLFGRFSVIVIEKHVLDYLLRSAAFTPGERSRVAYADRVFKERPVAICFKRDAQGLAHQKLFNSIAAELDLDRAEKEYWQRVNAEAVAPARRAGGRHP